MSKRKFNAIPPAGASAQSQARTVDAMRDVVTFITGQTQPEIQPVSANPTNAELAAKVNELIARLQGTAS